jgi:hypothetical protein
MTTRGGSGVAGGVAGGVGACVADATRDGRVDALGDGETLHAASSAKAASRLWRLIAERYSVEAYAAQPMRSLSGSALTKELLDV